MLDLRGCGTALVTPFLENGEVDYDAYAALVARQVSAGIDFLVPLATTGETPTLSVEEKRKLLGLTKENAGHCPLLVGCGSNSVPGTLANMAALDSSLVDAWLVVVPFYNKPTQEGQYQYFKTIAQAADHPIVIYNVPGRTGANMTAETCLRLSSDCPNIIGIKEASGNVEQVRAILAGAPAGFNVLSGDDDLTVTIMESGAAGVISVASNIFPAKLKAMTDAARNARWEDARAIDKALNPLFKACFVESNPIPAKAALSLMGLCKDAMRLPLVPASQKTREIMSELIAE